MLRSTHQAVNRPPPPPPPSIASLPEGWTEHTAPSGHKYYYHAATKKSTYTRPSIPLPVPALQHNDPAHWHQQSAVSLAQFPGKAYGALPVHSHSTHHASHHGHDRRNNEGRRKPADRPKHAKKIPNCAPWVLVTTKLGRRFVHNPESGESFWKFPPDVMSAVIKFDHAEREGKTIEEKPAEKREIKPGAEPEEGSDAGEESEYEEVEVEVTDSEEEEPEYEEDGDVATKRPKLEPEDQPHEFNEDDIAYQLEGIDEDEDIQRELDAMAAEGEEEDLLSPEDAGLLFQDMLDDHRVNPFTPWETVIENDAIIDDSRYTVLPNMKSRLAVFNQWSRQRIEEAKEAKAKQEKRDPRIGYLALLDKKASTKLYWPEFKRKYRSEPAMKDVKLLDREREKLYREHVKRIQQSQSSLKDDLGKLLQSIPLSILNRSTSINALPSALISDVRFISLPERTRTPIIESHLSKLPEAPEDAERSEAEKRQDEEKRADRERRERALAEREHQAREQAMRNSKSIRQSRRMLEEEQRDLQEAMRPGMTGLKSQLKDDAVATK